MLAWASTMCYNRRMNDTQHELIEEKYGALIHKIAHYISGDRAIATHEDNVQDIWMAAMEAIRGYEKKEQQSFDEFWGSKGFDKYIKTCLWNIKANKGAKITKKFKINRDVVSISDNQEVLTIVDESVPDPEFDMFMEDTGKILTDEELSVVSILIQDPSYIKPSGKANIEAVSRFLNKTRSQTSAIIDSISDKIQNQL